MEQSYLKDDFLIPHRIELKFKSINMRKIFVSILFITTSISFAQSAIATTEDGKRVLLRDNNTWYYESKAVVSENDCILESNYVEPKSE